VIERRIEMETIRQPALDKEGKPILGPDGKPLMQEIQRPMVISPPAPQQTQWSPKDMYENLVQPILEQTKPKSPEPEKTIDEDKLADKITGKVKESVDEVKGSVAKVEERINEMERRWEQEKAYREGYEKAAKEYGGGRLPLDHHKLNVQRDVFQQSVIPELRGVRQDLRDIGVLHYLALVEERRGVPAGTLLKPYFERVGLGEVVAEVEKPTTIAEKRAFIARLRGVD